jgi:hypothetical protein
MRSKVAELTREEQNRYMLSLTPLERIELAYALGEEDLVRYMAGNSLTREEALSRIRIERQQGRHYSRAKAG